MPDYQNGKIYKLVNDENDDVYYGSTTQPLSKRIYDHKNLYNSFLKNISKFNTSFNIVKYPSCKIILVENFPCNSKYELEARERYYIENFKCVNKNIPTRTDKQRREDQKELIKQYYIDNKNTILKQNKKYYENNKEKIKIRTQKYIENNKEKIKNKRILYDKQNYERFKERHRITDKLRYEYKKSHDLWKIDPYLFC